MRFSTRPPRESNVSRVTCFRIEVPGVRIEHRNESIGEVKCGIPLVELITLEDFVR
jgi:hypothetical protein